MPGRDRFGNWQEVFLADGRRGWVQAEMVKVIHDSLPVMVKLQTPGERRSDARRLEFLGAVGGPAVAGTTAYLLIGFALSSGLKGLFNDWGDVHGASGVSSTTTGIASWAGWTAYALTPLAAGGGAYLVGQRVNPGGNLWVASLGSLAGGLVGAGIGEGVDGLVFRYPTQYTFASLGAGLGTTFGAIYGYDLSQAHHERTLGQALSVRPPVVGLGMCDSGLRRYELGLDLRIVNLGF